MATKPVDSALAGIMNGAIMLFLSLARDLDARGAIDKKALADFYDEHVTKLSAGLQPDEVRSRFDLAMLSRAAKDLRGPTPARWTPVLIEGGKLLPPDDESSH